MKAFWIFLLFLLSFGKAQLNETVPLFDLKQAGADIDFQKHISNDSFSGSAWQFGTYPMNNQNIRYYHTCIENASTIDNLQNWLLMPKIKTVAPLTQLHAEVGFMVRKCDNAPEDACHKEVKLMAYPIAIEKTITKNWHLSEDWQFVGILSALSPKVDNTHIVTFNYTPTASAVYFGFNDNGACLTINHIKVYSTLLPPKNNFIWGIVKNYGLYLLIAILIVLVFCIGAIIIWCIIDKKHEEQQEPAPDNDLDSLNNVEVVENSYDYRSNYNYNPVTLPLNIERGITTLGTSFALREPDDDVSVVSS